MKQMPKVGQKVRITSHLSESESGHVVVFTGSIATVEKADARRRWVWLKLGRRTLPAVSIRNVEPAT